MWHTLKSLTRITVNIIAGLEPTNFLTNPITICHKFPMSRIDLRMHHHHQTLKDNNIFLKRQVTIFQIRNRSETRFEQTRHGTLVRLRGGVRRRVVAEQGDGLHAADGGQNQDNARSCRRTKVKDGRSGKMGGQVTFWSNWNKIGWCSSWLLFQCS